MVKRMKKTINILGEKYSYIKVNPEEIAGYAGQANYQERTIKVIKGMSKKDTDQTLIHECIHIILHTVGVDQTMSLEMTEVLCESIPTALLQNFRISLKK